MNKDVVELAEEHEFLRPSPLLVGERIDDGEEFEEELESVIDDGEWKKYNSNYYENNLEN